MRRAVTEAEGTPAMQPLALAGLALALLAQGKKGDALAFAQNAFDAMEKRAGRVEDPRTVKLALVETLIATGRGPEGGKLLAELAVELLEQANRLRDPAVRRAFLQDVDDHARVFVLQGALANTE